MPIRFNCECGNPIMVSDDLAGRRGQCEKCLKIVTIPELPGVQSSEVPSGARGEAAGHLDFASSGSPESAVGDQVSFTSSPTGTAEEAAEPTSAEAADEGVVFSAAEPDNELLLIPASADSAGQSVPLSAGASDGPAAPALASGPSTGEQAKAVVSKALSVARQAAEKLAANPAVHKILSGKRAQTRIPCMVAWAGAALLIISGVLPWWSLTMEESRPPAEAGGRADLWKEMAYVNRLPRLNEERGKVQAILQNEGVRTFLEDHLTSGEMRKIQNGQELKAYMFGVEVAGGIVAVLLGLAIAGVGALAWLNPIPVIQDQYYWVGVAILAFIPFILAVVFTITAPGKDSEILLRQGVSIGPLVAVVACLVIEIGAGLCGALRLGLLAPPRSAMASAS